MFASMKEPDTAYINKLTGTVYSKKSNSEIPQAVDFWLVVFNHMTVSDREIWCHMFMPTKF